MGLHIDRNLEAVREIAGGNVGPFDESLAHAAGGLVANLQTSVKKVEPSEFDIDPTMPHEDVVREAAKLGAKLAIASLREAGALPEDDHRPTYEAGLVLNSKTANTEKRPKSLLKFLKLR